MSQRLSSIVDPDFAAEAAVDGHDIVVQLSGSADTSVKNRLRQFLGGIHAEALLRRVHAVHVDFQEVAFINSSCLKDFFSWILELQDTAPDQQYRIHIRSNERRAWQHRSLRTLASFGEELVVMEH